MQKRHWGTPGDVQRKLFMRQRLENKFMFIVFYQIQDIADFKMYIISCIPLKKKKYSQNSTQRFLITQNFYFIFLKKII